MWFNPQPELSVMSFPMKITPVVQRTAMRKSHAMMNLRLNFSRQYRSSEEKDESSDMKA